MRVLFIYQFLTLGGVESVLRNRYLGLKGLGRGVEVETLFLSQSVKQQRELGDRVVISCEASEITKAVRHADVVCVIDTPQVFEVLDGLTTPVIVEVHSAYDQGRAYIHQPLPRSTRMLLTPSEAFQGQIRRELRRKDLRIEHLPNPLDPAYFESGSAGPEHLDLHGGQPIFWVGRLDELKDWQRAVRIAARVISTVGRDEVELFVLGRHVDPTAPAAEFRKAGILGRVRHVASVGFHAMPALYRAVAANGGIHLSTSKAESFGMTVAESMASGLPCVVHDLPVFEEVSAGRALFFKTDKEAVGAAARLLTDRAAWERCAGELQPGAQRYRSERVAELLYQRLEQAAAR